MTDSKIPLLTEIIETGENGMANRYRPSLSAEVITTALTNDALNRKIEAAIDAVLPAIKRQLHQQLLSALSKQDIQ